MNFRRDNEYYSTLTVPLDSIGIFVHEAGHCLGAFHDRYTSLEQEVISSLDDRTQGYNYG